MFDRHYDHWQDLSAALDHWPWPNFNLETEIACRDGSAMVNKYAMDRLQWLRNALGKAMHVNSAYRSAPYNAKVGGHPNSQHMKALAFDISMNNHAPHVFEAAARRNGFTGFGYYPESNFMHIDIAYPRWWGTRWEAGHE